MPGKHFSFVSFLILIFFCVPLVTLNAVSSATHPIVLTPQKFSVGTKVKVSLRLITRPGMAAPQRISAGVDNKVLFQKNYGKTAVSKTWLPSFFWTAQSGKHRIWFKIKRHNLTKAQHFVRNIYVTYQFKSLKVKKIRPQFRLKSKYKIQLREVAKLMLKKAPASMIKLKMRAIHQRYHSETEGAGHQADEEALKVLQDEVQKEIWEQEKEKAEQQQESQKEHIKRLMEMLKEIMKLWTNSYNSTNIILQ